VSNVAIKIGKAAFFAPPTVTVPESRPPPTISINSDTCRPSDEFFEDLNSMSEPANRTRGRNKIKKFTNY
jgi:hypothetical protein